MSGKRIALMFLVLCCLTVSACSTAVSPAPEQADKVPLNTGLNSPAAPSETPVEYKQNSENLPEAKSLTTFPGVLESMSMTLEQIVTVLGTQFNLIEDKAQNYDTYSFPQYNLSFDFDKMSKKISTIWLGQIPYYVYSGDFKTYDFDGDGNPEKIFAYEDQQFNGRLLILDGGRKDYCEANLDFLGSKCDIEVLSGFGTDKENLILVKTSGGDGGDVLRWSEGKAVSILPQDYKKLSETSMVTVEGDKAVFVNEAKNILYICPLPDRAAENINGRSDSGVYRFGINLQPSVSGDSMVLKARTSLQIMISDNYNFLDNTDGTFCDVAQATVEYQYLGQGKWQEKSISGGPKYEGSADAALSPEDLSIGGMSIYEDYKKLDKNIANSLAAYTPAELEEGVVLEKEGMSIGITGGQVTYLSLDEESGKSTSKGLKLSDIKDKALSLYGLPDKGYVEDPVWTYYVLSEEVTGSAVSVSVNTLNIEFSGEKLCRIWMSSYITAY